MGKADALELALTIKMAMKVGEAGYCTGCEPEHGIVCARCSMMSILKRIRALYCDVVGEVLKMEREMNADAFEELKQELSRVKEDLRLERLKSKGLHDYCEFLEMPGLECYMRLDGLYHATLDGCEGTIDAVGEEYEDALKALYKKLQKEAEARKKEDEEE